MWKGSTTRHDSSEVESKPVRWPYKPTLKNQGASTGSTFFQLQRTTIALCRCQLYKTETLNTTQTSCCGSRETRLSVARLFFCGLQLFDTVLPEHLKFERRWSLVFVTRLGRRLLAQMRERWLRTRCRCHAQRRDQGERYQAPPRESTWHPTTTQVHR